jgi:hypothetical protein
MKPSKQGIERAIQLVHRAKEIAGENALIHATLARCYSHSFEFGISHDRETLQREPMNTHRKRSNWRRTSD